MGGPGNISPGLGLIEQLLPDGQSDGGGGLSGLAEEERLRKKREAEAAEAARIAAQEAELAPLRKSLRDEVEFLGKKYTMSSKIGGRGAF